MQFVAATCLLVFTSASPLVGPAADIFNPPCDDVNDVNCVHNNNNEDNSLDESSNCDLTTSNTINCLALVNTTDHKEGSGDMTIVITEASDQQENSESGDWSDVDQNSTEMITIILEPINFNQSTITDNILYNILQLFLFSANNEPEYITKSETHDSTEYDEYQDNSDDSSSADSIWDIFSKLGPIQIKKRAIDTTSTEMLEGNTTTEEIEDNTASEVMEDNASTDSDSADSIWDIFSKLGSLPTQIKKRAIETTSTEMLESNATTEEVEDNTASEVLEDIATTESNSEDSIWDIFSKLCNISIQIKKREIDTTSIEMLESNPTTDEDIEDNASEVMEDNPSIEVVEDNAAPEMLEDNVSTNPPIDIPMPERNDILFSLLDFLKYNSTSGIDLTDPENRAEFLILLWAQKSTEGPTYPTNDMRD